MSDRAALPEIARMYGRSMAREAADRAERADPLRAAKEESDGTRAIVFERWRGARYHVRRQDGSRNPPTFCGMVPHPLTAGPSRRESELPDDQMCKTCRREARKQLQGAR